MTPGDLRRVREARQRLSAADASVGSDDSAIRIVELLSPRPGERSLPLDRAFCVVFGLSNAARQALSATIDAVRSGNEDMGLDGIVETYGRRLPMHKATELAPKVPGTALVPLTALFGRTTARTAEASTLIEVIDTIDRAVLLSGAELRGADAAALHIEEQIEAERARSATRPPGTSLEIVPMRSDDAQVLAALESVAPPAEVVVQIREALDLVRNDPVRTRLEAASSQAQAAKSQVLPTDGKDVAMLADLAVAEADGVLAEYDMSPDSPAGTLTAHLQALGISASPFEAEAMAERVVAESAELDAIRLRLTKAVDEVQDSPALTALLDERRTIDRRRMRIQRRLRSQQQSLAIVREQALNLGVGIEEGAQALHLREDGERPMPILIEEPLADLPARLSGAILSTLLRHSTHTQVILVSDQLDLRQWCNSVGERAGWLAAEGWFAGRNNEC